MLASSHVLIGVGGFGLLSAAAGYEVTPLVLGAAAFGSLLPDIDHPQSWLGRRLRFVSLPIAAVFGHRGITHSLAAVAGVSVGAWLLQGSSHALSVLALGFGYLSHLAADWLTPSGVPLAWPCRRKFASPFPIQTGGLVERLATLGVGGSGMALSGFAAAGDLLSIAKGLAP